MSIESAKQALAGLVEKFQKESSSGSLKEYNEEQTKKTFIEPLLEEVLGWDVKDRNEVSFEHQVSRGRVDYGLKLEGRIKLFVEAKPLGTGLEKYREQAIGYGYSQKDGVPFVLLTNFQELELFDVTVKPDFRNLNRGRKLLLRWDEYLQKFDELWKFSKESAKSGELDKLVFRKPEDKRLDRDILDDLAKWRLALAKDVFKNNPELFHSEDKGRDADYLKEITQRLLDRIIFMRFCEDRNLVERDSLRKIFEERSETVGTNTMLFLQEEFKKYSTIFNSDLFRHQDWEDGLAVDFKVIKDIISGVLPYQFDIIPLEILGRIYEQYLGYTIRLTDHQVRYEPKDEAKKAGGVYYTPEYIVDYIVKNTVGKILQDSKRGRGDKLTILDPACGSGSFLIRAYEEMLNYYRDQRKRNWKKKQESRGLDLGYKESKPKLSVKEKSGILCDHIWGVDIDKQAVEVTKLSLMLKMLEDESGAIPGRSILPMLDKNIKCGNSLIGTDFYQDRLLDDFDYTEKRKTNAFDWEIEFPEIFKNGGFDVVIGNPPYIDSETMVTSGQKVIRKFISQTYKTTKGNWDIYIAFFEKGLNLLNTKGVLAYITPDKWLIKPFGDELRKRIINNVTSILKAGRGIFENSKVDSIVTIISKKPGDKLGIFILENNKMLNKIEIHKNILKSPYPLDFLFSRYLKLLLKLELLPSKVSDWADCENACATSDAYKLKPLIDSLSNNIFNKEEHLKIINTGTIGKYVSKWGKQEMRYLGNKYLFPVVNKKRFLKEFKNTYARKSIQPKIIIKSLTLLDACIDEEGIYIPGKSTLIVIKCDIYIIKLLSAILNSKLALFYLKEKYPSSSYNQGINFTKDMINKLPIPKISESNKKRVVNLVDYILDLTKKLRSTKIIDEKTMLEREIKSTNIRIDNLVYVLYNITEKERKIIEDGLNV